MALILFANTVLLTVPVYPLGTQGPGAVQKSPDKLDLTRFSGYKFRFSCAKGACKSSAPRARNELKLALATKLLRGAASPLVRFVKGEERWEAPDHPQGVLPLNWGEIELNRSVTCMVLKATANDRRHLALCHDEFRGP
ncbi:uncharacterized protein TNCV_4819331 [Trichonephila clavipes]|nr:uncharacterized protein TNCV_4819331 [Trichonephila clavipes]